MTSSEETQMKFISAIDVVCEGYLNTTFHKAKRACDGDADKAMEVIVCLSVMYRLRDQLKTTLSDSVLDF